MALSPNTSSLQSADLSTFLRINKGFPFHVTYKGNDAVVYQHALSNFFSQNPVTWKRHNKFFPYPLTFPLKFIPFDDKHVFTFDSTIEELKSFGFLHIFFINVASADEYRSNIRHTVSEWFAGLSLRPELQWLIVIDTTRAKERKNRSNLMDKIKTDFSKHHHKLIEVSDSVEHSSFSALTTAVQAGLLAHLELLTETWERCLKTGRERCVAKDWSLIECVNQELDYARLFWSMGALDHSLKLYEELDGLVFHQMTGLSGIPTFSLPSWAADMRKAEMEECPTLLESMRESQITRGTGTVAGIRHLILSHKLLLSVHLYHARVHAAKNAASPGSRCDYAAVLMKYANNTLHGVIEHLVVMNSTLSPARLSVWIIQLVGEALYLSCLLADVNTVENAKEAVAAMHSRRFKELLNIAELCTVGREEEKKQLAEWMDGIVRKREEGGEKMTKQHRDSALLVLSSCLSSPTSLEQTLLRAHDAASSFLTQSDRRRSAAQIGYEFARFLSRQGNAAAALPYYLRFAGSLIDSGETSESMLRVIEEAVEKMDKREDYERIVRFLLYIGQNTRDEGKRREISGRLKRELERGREEGRREIRLTEWTEQFACPVRVRLSRKEQTAKIVPGERISIRVHLSPSEEGGEQPALPLERASVRVTLSALDSRRVEAGGGERGEQPVFDVEYRLAESRLVCLNKGSRRPSRSPSLLSTETVRSDGGVEGGVTLEHEGVVEKIGKEGVEVDVDTVARKKGIFMLERVELSLYDGALSLSLPPSCMTRERKMMMVIVEETKHVIEFPQGGRVLESGVSCRLPLLLRAGSQPLQQSELRVTVEEGERADCEFESPDGLWESLVVLPLPSMEKEERLEREIGICLPLEGEVREEESVRKIRLEWAGRSFVHLVRFSPLFSARFTNDHLESRMLLDLELARPASSPSRCLIVPIEATLTVKSAGAKIEPKLMFFEGEPIAPRGVSSFTWLAETSADGPPTVPFRLSLRYRIEGGAGEGTGEGRKRDEREYEYRLEGDLEMRRVQYEVCSQVLSQQPGAQLCRVGTPCHLLVSIRALSIDESDALVVAVMADERLWEIGERQKVLHLKESGLGQVYLLVTPLVAGFLPFPSVQLYAAASSLRSEDRFWSDSSESILSSTPFFIFERTGGKQIRVLGASGGGGEGSIGREKRTIKEKLQKLFD